MTAATFQEQDTGWIALARSSRIHRIVGMGMPVEPADAKRGSYSRFEAWVDLLMMASHGPSRWVNKGRETVVGTGQLPGAYSFLADRWNWSLKTVRYFLTKLVEHAMIAKAEPEVAARESRQRDEGVTKPGKQKGNQVQIITVCNYSRYQVSREDEGQASGPRKGKRGASQGHESNNGTIDRSTNVDSSPAAAPAVDAPAEPVPAKRDLIDAVIELEAKRVEELRGFEDFWKLYPNKKGKAAAQKIWKRMKLDVRRKAYLALKAQLPALEAKKADTRGNFCPHPSTWLNQGRWDDEIEPVDLRGGADKPSWERAKDEKRQAEQEFLLSYE